MAKVLHFGLPQEKQHAALFEMLAALWLALGPYSPGRSFWTGCAAAVGFLTYNGYWVLGGCILTLHSVLGHGGGRRFFVRAACAGAGLLAPVVAAVGGGEALSRDLLASYFKFAGNVVQGDFFLGYRAIGEYLWCSERGLGLLWLAAIAYAVGAGVRARELGRLGWWLGGIALLGGSLVFFSDVVPRFVVHGRLSRGLVPSAMQYTAAARRRTRSSVLSQSANLGRPERPWAFCRNTSSLCSRSMGCEAGMTRGPFAAAASPPAGAAAGASGAALERDICQSRAPLMSTEAATTRPMTRPFLSPTLPPEQNEDDDEDDDAAQ